MTTLYFTTSTDAFFIASFYFFIFFYLLLFFYSKAGNKMNTKSNRFIAVAIADRDTARSDLKI